MYEPVIGLEIHIQLKTKTKMFCGCSTKNASMPNENICPICMGHPGTLPTPNLEAVKAAIKIGLALKCNIAEYSKFDRKNYFYPDLPKGYQISQFDLPVAENGFLDVKAPKGAKNKTARISILRAHLEEDSAKSIHGKDGITRVDYNRAGIPLVEVVTNPDFRSAAETKKFLQELRLIARYLGISNADMEKGQLRCDANISLRQLDKKGNLISETLNPKTEVKNLNSFKHVERAIEYEIQRQTKLWERGIPPNVCSTRGWNETLQRTDEQRIKEDTQDYRFFPEPDIPPLNLTDLTEEIRGSLPELPAARRIRLADEYFLKPADVNQICDNLALADFTEQVFSELEAWINALPEFDDMNDKERLAEKKKLARLVSTWLLTKLTGLLSERKIGVRTMKVNAENFAELISLLSTKKMNATVGLKVLNIMLDDGSDPSHIMEDQQLGAMDDADEIAAMVDKVLESYPAEVKRYLEGKTELTKFFLGQIMRESKGTADAGIARNMLMSKLEGIIID